MNHIPALLAIAALGFGEPGGIIAAIDRAQLVRDDRLLSYTVTEHYTVKNVRFGAAAELVAQVTYTKGAGKVYDVISRTGSAMMQSKVLDRLLAEETQMSGGDKRRASLITSDNYLMKPRGEQDWNGRPALLFEITPRHKGPDLLKGKLWIDAASANIVRIEGALVESPSFLAGSTTLYRDYTEIGEFAFAQRSVAVSNSFLMGKTEMTIEYTGYTINVEK